MKKVLLLAAATLLSLAAAIPAEACPLFPLGASARQRRQERRANSGGIIRIVLPPYGR